MSSKTQETIKNVDGQAIFFRSWRPELGARATLIIIPGFNAHSAYYEWVAERFVADGLAVYAIDLQGRGQSEGERFFVETFEDYVGDVEAVKTVVDARDPGNPVILLGHSAGGVVACLYALDHPSQLTGLISESFAHELPAPDFVLSVFKGLSHIAPHTHLLHLPNEKFSRDPAAVETMNEDPLIEKETQPVQTMAALVRADERLKKEFPEITLPVLILHGTADENTRPSGSQHFHDAVGSVDKTLKLYEGGYHDLLNDLDKETVLSDIMSWIDAHLPTVVTP
ncbi:alpha-beta hydrolase superfamily lysophospholipase [Granulicella aggregans]|uniref:Alpha-beta hydrolase superfamily lysophospholipase n=1 Tax=Granulicella aggregans TaxID=474949 RepID=A0A7W8E5G6_9BACT|nr:alpha/beta hydrolase [Granulicella aggregans]MBB5059642.1 alpha-beta hydrolase superfamily lysophospholipase [Granulicella aggregans]